MEDLTPNIARLSYFVIYKTSYCSVLESVSGYSALSLNQHTAA